MSGILKPKTVSTTDPRVSTFQVTQSSYGTPIPIIFGTTLVPGAMLDYDDYTAIANTTTTSSGGKGGSVNSQQTSWTYTVAAAICLGEGPLTTVGQIWANNSVGSLGSNQMTFFDGEVGQSPWGYMQSNHPEKAIGYSGICYVAGVLDLGGDTSLPNYNFEVYGLCQNAQATPSTNLMQQYSYQKNIDVSNWVSDAGVYEYVFGQGWVLLNSMFYTIAQKKDAYGNYIAGVYTYTFNFDDRTDGNDRADPLNIQIHYVATAGSVQYTASDANPSDEITQLTTNQVFGAQILSAYLGDLSDYSAYCVENSLLLSDGLITQQSASDIITNILEATNSDAIWSQGKFQIVPYYDGLIPVYELNEDNILGQDDDSIVITRNSQADSYNVVPLEYYDRANGYNTSTVYASDQGDIDLNGVRQMSTVEHHHITTPALAQTIAQSILQKQLYVRNQYVLKLGQEFILLEVMDATAIACETLGLDPTAVRVVSIKESKEDYSLEFTFEDNPTGIHSSPTYETQVTTRGIRNSNVDPGNVNPPVIFEPPDALGSDLELLIGASGGPNWGGADIWISEDQNTYKRYGTINASARQGVLSESIASGNDPDITDTLAIDMTLSGAQLLSGTQSDADNYNTLCYVDGELISYETATLTGVNQYNLSYLRRGAYGTTIKAHNAGTQFERVDMAALFSYPFTQADIGKTIYIKFTSINVFGGAEQSQADVQAYSYTIQGSALNSPLPNVENLKVIYQNNNAVLTWDSVSDFRNPILYEIRKGTTWGQAQVLGRVSETSFVLPGNDTYWIAAVYQVIYNGITYTAYSPTPQDIPISEASIPTNIIATSDEMATGWQGALSGGACIQGNQLILVGSENFSTIPDVAAATTIEYYGGVASTGSYTIPESHIVQLSSSQLATINCGYSMQVLPALSKFSQVADVAQLADFSGNNPQYGNVQIQINIMNSSGVWSGWQNFIPGQYFGKAFNIQMLLTSSNEQYTVNVSDFYFDVNVPDNPQYGNIVIPAAGQSVLYPTVYNMIPSPVISIFNAQAGDTIVLSNQTESGFTVQITNSGIGVLRQINWVANGY